MKNTIAALEKRHSAKVIDISITCDYFFDISSVDAELAISVRDAKERDLNSMRVW